MRRPAALILCGLVGCANSGYTPTISGRLAYVVRSGSLTLVRDGHEYSLGGLFSDGEAVAAVDGVPAAGAAMHDFLVRRRWATVLLLLGSVATTAGAIVWIDQGGGVSKPLLGGLLGGGTGLSLVGVSLSLSGVARLFDAVNLYNDGAGR